MAKKTVHDILFHAWRIDESDHWHATICCLEADPHTFVAGTEVVFTYRTIF